MSDIESRPGSASSVTGIVSFLSSTEREGRWALPRHLRALAVLGNVEIDLRDAVIGVGIVKGPDEDVLTKLGRNLGLKRGDG